jgi:Tol biopolymer transport system component
MHRFVLPLALLAAAPAAAQIGFGAYNGRNHPELDWQVARTAHFEIVYPAHLAGIEAEAAAVAEASYDALSENLGGVTFDDPIRIYLSDEDEVANGSAWDVGSAGFTTIWVHVNEFADVWTGEAKWLRKVLAHELAHLFHFRAVQSRVGLLQNLVAFPYPRWWVEGLAQYETERWDSERGDRWLRTAVFEDRINPDDGGSVWNGRLLYAAGNSQVRYLADTYGDSTLVNILRHRKPILGLFRVHDFADAFEDVVGKPYSAFQEEWRKHVNVYYNTLAGQMERVDSLGTKPLALPGQYVYAVAYSPDTSRIAAVVLSSLVRPVRRLFVMNNTAGDSTKTRDVRVLAEGTFEGPITWSPSGDRIAYARTVRGRHGSLVNDLYVVDVATGRKERLTENRRAVSPTFAPDGRRLAFVGVDGGTANVFVLDLETGAETALTRFEGDVQITSARWEPGGDRVAFAVFDAEGRRRLTTVGAATGALTAVPTGADLPSEESDSRLPVWRPDGGALAFVSLRDEVPNVFSVPVGGEGEGGLATGHSGSTSSYPPSPQSPVPSPPTARSAESRVTYLYAGATVHDWLPPDSLHPAGRLVLVATETKRRDRVYVVDADRPLTADAAAPPVVPSGYASWTDHRPPREIPFSVAPDSSLITGRGGYNSLANLTHALTLPLPYADPENDDYGVFANSIWLEPLGKHQLVVLAGVSVTRFVDKSFLLLQYTNNTLAPSLSLNLYRFPSPSSFYGTGLLVEDLTGGDLSATLPLDLTDAPFTTTAVGARLRYAYAEPFDLAEGVDLSASGGDLPQPEEGFRADLQLGFAWKRQRPYRYNALAPLDGLGLRARVTLGAPVLGSHNEFVRPDLAAYTVLPVFGFGQLFLYGRATAVFGEPFAQDFVGLARYDDFDLQVPFVGPLTLDDAERVRGYRRYAVGDRALFGTVEWRLPAVLDLDTKLLGLVELDRLGVNLFADGGLVWTGTNLDGAIRRTGLGVEAANLLRLGPFELRHALGVAAPWGALDADLVWDDVDLYYRLQAAVPF